MSSSCQIISESYMSHMIEDPKNFLERSLLFIDPR